MSCVFNSGDEEVEIDVELSSRCIRIVPSDDVILEVEWSHEHNRLVCIARISPEA